MEIEPRSSMLSPLSTRLDTPDSSLQIQKGHFLTAPGNTWENEF